jgi:glycosyltransferase involved in cell wall biosynthesis
MTGVLVHEWISRTGGSEKVFDAMVSAFPEADILCLWNDDRERYPDRNVYETWLAKTPLRKSKASALPFMPATWRNRLSNEYEWALVSSHLFAHHVSFARQPKDFRKLVYVHSPARYIWTPDLDRRGAGIVPRLASPPLRALDRRRAQEAHSIAANSAFVADRILHAWHRHSTIIHPPVDVEQIQSVSSWADQLTEVERLVLESLPKEFVLGASRFVPYKRLDLVIAAGEAAGVPVVLSGSGPEEGNLRSQAEVATVPVIFVRSPSDALLYALYAAAMVFVFPAVEDFGIMPVEAMASGTPVAVGPLGGARETVEDGKSGAVAVDSTGASFARAIERCLTVEPSSCARRARDFSKSLFQSRLASWVLTGEGPNDSLTLPTVQR